MQVTIEHRNRFGPQGTGAFFAAFTYESDLGRVVPTADRQDQAQRFH